MARVSAQRIDQRKQAGWIRRLEQWESSGMSPRAFCIHHGLKTTQFFWWKRTLQERGKWKSKLSAVTLAEERQPLEARFAAVEIRQRDLERAQEDQSMDLWVGERYRIRIGQDFDPYTLERVLCVLERGGC